MGSTAVVRRRVSHSRALFSIGLGLTSCSRSSRGTVRLFLLVQVTTRLRAFGTVSFLCTFGVTVLQQITKRVRDKLGKNCNDIYRQFGAVFSPDVNGKMEGRKQSCARLPGATGSDGT